VLALAAPQRHTGMMANVPTWRESGVDAVFLNWRGVVGPRAMSPAQVSYWESVLERLAKTPEWMRNVEHDFQINDYKSSAETKALWNTQYNEIRASMVQLGLIK
jgi:putative tricarboxylic transport membrane protein